MTRVSLARLTGVRIIVPFSCRRANYTMLARTRMTLFSPHFRTVLLALISRDDDGSRVLVYYDLLAHLAGQTSGERTTVG